MSHPEGGHTLQVRAKHRLTGLQVDTAFEAPPGITVLFGPSGAGKTTTLRIIAGLVDAPESSVRLGDEVWNGPGVHRPPEKRKVALVFQTLALFPHLTALENVRFGARDPELAERWLERFRVTHTSARKPPSLSGGEAQRVALARAMASEPRVLLLDEPLSSLEESLRERLDLELRDVIIEAALPTVVVTHDRAQARRLAQSVVLVDGGRVVATGGPELLEAA